MFWMPNFGRSSAPAPATSGFPLSVSDLWSQAQEPDYPVPPEILSSFGQLDPAVQKRAKRDQILQMIAAGLQQTGSGPGQGQMGTAMLASIAGSRGGEQQLVDEENARRQQKFGYERQKAQVQADTMKAQVQGGKDQRAATAVIGKAQHLWELAADDPQLQGRIATAAQRGPDAMEELSKLEASLPGRQALRKAGVDPDDPMQVQAAQAAAKLKQEQAQKEADLKQQNDARLALENQLRDQKLGGYKPEYHAPHEGSNITAADGSVYHVVDGKVTGKVEIPGGARGGQQGLDPLREALRVAEAEYKAMLIPKEQIKGRAKELYDLMTGGVEGLDGETAPPVGSSRVAKPLQKAPPPPAKPGASGNARLIPGAGGADPFAAVKDPAAKTFAQQQLAKGVPMAKILAYLKQHGAI